MNYVTPQESIAKHLINEGVLSTGEVFLDYMPDFDDLSTSPNIITSIKMITGNSNPKWMRDDITLVIQVLGRNRLQTQPASTLAYEVFNKLLGADNLEIDGYTYFRFIAPSGMPRFIDYMEDGKPLYTMSISLVREAQVAEGNRETIS